MERDASQRYVKYVISRFLFPVVILNFISVGGEVPRLVAVEGEVEPDGRYALMFFYKSTISVPPNMNCSIFTR